MMILSSSDETAMYCSNVPNTGRGRNSLQAPFMVIASAEINSYFHMYKLYKLWLAEHETDVVISGVPICIRIPMEIFKCPP